MRVVFVLWQGGIGGAELHTVGLAAALTARGHWVGVLTLSSPGVADRALDDLSLPHRTLSLRRGRDVLVHGSDLRKILSSAHADVVILPHNDGLPVLLRLYGYVGPMVAMEHGAALKHRGLTVMRHLRYLAARKVGRRILCGEIAVSEFAARNLVRLPHARIAVVHNGIDMLTFRPRERRGGDAADTPQHFVVGMAGRLVPGKGFDVAIRAVAEVNGLGGSTARVELCIAGDGPERGRLQRLAASLGSATAVRLLGKTLDMPTFWNSLDLAVHVPDTFLETFGLVALEAVGCGCRVLVAATESSEELLRGCPGVTMVQKGDPHILAEQIALEMRRSPATSDERTGMHAWVAERYSLAETARQYEALLTRWLRG
jgi:glycosyltransferase involved in cell wall biosynthesis